MFNDGLYVDQNLRNPQLCCAWWFIEKKCLLMWAQQSVSFKDYSFSCSLKHFGTTTFNFLPFSYSLFFCWSEGTGSRHQVPQLLTFFCSTFLECITPSVAGTGPSNCYMQSCMFLWETVIRRTESAFLTFLCLLWVWVVAVGCSMMPQFRICNCIVWCLLWEVERLVIEVKYSTICSSDYIGQTVPEPVECTHHCSTLSVQ
jgi:hypothetical protein